MPLWLWLVLLAVALAFLAFRRYGEHAALKRRQQELAAQRSQRERFEREQVIEACQKAAEVLGKRATAEVTPAKVTVNILPGLVPSLSPVSPLVGIRLAPGGDGRVVVDARIEKYRTVQSTFMMIPIGPKTLVGRGTYFSLLKSLEQELRSVDGGQGSVRRTSAAG